MYEVAINTMAFEFECGNQISAKQIQQDVLHYAGPAFTKIIEQIFSEKEVEKNYIINKVEIDLGQINIEKFGDYEMLEKFSNSLLQQLETLKNTVHSALFSPGKINSLNVERLENEREIIEVFLLNGDVPWWVDKNSYINIDKVIKRIMKKNPAILKDFLPRNKHNQQVLKRISHYSKAETYESIIKLHPYTFNDFGAKMPFQHFLFQGLASITKLEDLIKPRYSETRKLSRLTSLKDTLIKKLLKLCDHKLADQIALLNVFTENELSVIHYFSSLKNKKNKSPKILVKLLEKLSLLQIEFLLFISRKYINDVKKNDIEAENFASLANENLTTSSDNETFLDSTIKQNVRKIENQHTSIHQQNLEKFNIAKQVIADVTQTQQKIISRPTNVVEVEEKSDVIHSEKVLNADEKHIKQNLLDNSLYSIVDVNKEEPDGNSLPEASNVINISKADKVLQQEEPSIFSELFAEAFTNETSLEKNPANVSEKLISFEEKDAKKFDSSFRDSLELKNNGSLSGRNVQQEKFIQAKNKQIDFLIKCLQSNDADLLQTLANVREEELQIISKKFKKYKRAERRTRKNVSGIIEHTYFLNYNLLQVVAFFSSGNAIREDVVTLMESVASREIKNKKGVVESLIKKVQQSKSSFFYAAQNMSEKEAFVINDILEKKNYSTDDEKKITNSFLAKLPEESVAMLSFLTSLSEEEIKKLTKIVTINLSETDIRKTEKYAEKVQRKVYIDNGGICLVAMYFSGLFNHLKYLEKNHFKNKFSAARALYLLQYLAEGKQKNAEYVLQLNKILCGFDVNENIPANIRLTKKEKSEADTLLTAVIENWRALKNTSLQGFRESFLHRKAILTESESYWTMQVERKGHDILLNTIPWNYHMIKFSWMKKMIKVEW